MQETLLNIFDNLKQITQQIKALLEIVRKERFALIDCKLEEVAQLHEQKIQVIHESTVLQNRLQENIQNIPGYHYHQQKKMREMIAELPKNPLQQKILALQDTVVALVKHLKKQNQQNLQLILNGLTQLEKTKAHLLHKDNALYGSSGQHQQPSNAQQFLLNQRI